MNKELKPIHIILSEVLNLTFSNPTSEEETGDYCGYNFQMGSLRIKYRKAKITPKKTGQFVALWKRSLTGKTEPYNLDDESDLYIIETQTNHNRGFFLFPKNILADKHILSTNHKEGKRGFRVYPKWDSPENKQATTSKNWQTL